MVLEVLHQLQACSPAPGESTPSWTSTLNHHCLPLNYVTWRTQIQGKIPTFIFTETLLTTFLYVCIEYSQGCLAMAGRWRSENNLQKVDVSFLFPPCGNGARVIRLMAKCFYPLSHLTGPISILLRILCIIAVFMSSLPLPLLSSAPPR